MAQQNSDSKILRIGVIQSGKVIEERLVRKRTTVTFGTDPKSTFVLPGGKDSAGNDPERSWALFEMKGTQYHLVFSDAMDGRVSVDNNNVDFASLKAQNLVQKQGDRYKLPLNDSSRGRVQLGSDLTILFHFVAAPPEMAKPELPAAAKGGWVKSIEPVFTGVLTGSFILHAIMTLVVFSVDEPPPPSLEDVKALMARVAPPKVEVAPTPPPEAPSTSDDATGPKKDEEKPKESGSDEPSGPPKKGTPGERAQAAADRRADVQSKIAGKGLLGLIGAKGDGAGALADVFGSGSALGNISTDVSGTGGVGLAGSGSDVTRRGEGGGGGGGGGAADIGSLGAGGGGAISTGTKQVAKIQPSVKADAIGELDGSIDKKGVGRALRARAQAFQQCYESALKTNSKLKGKLVVEFTISESGAVADARVLNDGLGSPEVSSCVIGALKRIRFPKPDDGEVTITNSFVFQPGG